jgi:Flp pilus assembly protein TadG
LCKHCVAIDTKPTQIKVKITLTSPVGNALTIYVPYGRLKLNPNDVGHTMKRNLTGQRKRGYVSRLIREETGNVLMITAFSMIPLMAMVGGAVDTARLYSVETRLQAACDAGLLTGRRVMSNGTWDVPAGAISPRVEAERMFDTNFTQGNLGTGEVTRTFTEANGVVSGTASVVVPMTIMQFVGQEESTVAVRCSGEMRIPHTDVMFVLDVTGSMNRVDMGSESRIRALQNATMCFYESLSKEDIVTSGGQAGVSNTQCGVSASPAGNLSQSVQLRFGFAPYATNVNVRDLGLPTSYFRDTQLLQSRVPNTQVVQTWTAGTESAPAYGAWSGYGTPSVGTYNNTGNTIAIPTSENTTGKRTSYCNSRTKAPTAYVPRAAGTTSNTNLNPAPVYPASTANMQNVTERVVSDRTAYRYIYSSGQVCNEQARNENAPRTRSGPTTSSITWTPYTRVNNWTYQQVTANVAGLKNGATAFNTSVDIPINDVPSVPVKLSGSNSAGSISLQGNLSVPWNGCIEEKQTFRNTDGNESDDWNPIPATAIDMDIDAIPTADPATQFGYSLPSAVWGRRDSSGNYTRADVIAGAAPFFGTTPPPGVDAVPSRGNIGFCPSASARRLTSYRGNTGADDFRNYVNSFVANGNTYHDIGLLWGARMLSPTGMFASENALTANGQEIKRHIILMTDGDPVNRGYDYGAYGINFHDRRQVITPTTSTDIAPINADLVNANMARTLAICERVKEEPNTTLWVIFFNPDTSAQEPNFRMCASGTPGQEKFYDARTNAQLVQVFRDIATEISELRITE